MKSPMNLKHSTLAFDLGTDTGYAYGEPGIGLVDSGSVCLGKAKENTAARKLNMNRRLDARFTRLCEHVQSLIARFPGVERVTFEDVEFSTSQAQGQLWATLRSALWCAAPNLIYHCVAPGTLKKHFTGSGKAEKSDMADALEKTPWYAGKFRSIKGMAYHLSEERQASDDEVDALALLHYTAAVDSGAANWLYKIA